jgi:hypothetical protein
LECIPNGGYEILYLTDRGRTAGTFPAGAALLGNGLRPSVTARGSSVFVAFSGPAEPYGDDHGPILFTTNRTGSWQTKTVYPRGETPSLRIGPDGRAHIAFTDGGLLHWARTRLVGGQPDYSTFTIATLSTPSGAVRPTLAVDSNGQPHIAWNNDSVETGGYGTYYVRRRTDGTWAGGRFTRIHWSVKLTLDGSNKPHILVLPSGAGVFYYRKVDGILQRQTLSSGAVANTSAIAIGASARPVVLFATTSGLPKGVYLMTRTV